MNKAHTTTTRAICTHLPAIAGDLNRLPSSRRKTEAQLRYADAIKFYASTCMPMRRLVEQCVVS